MGPDVLHTLHCLNAVRKLLDSPYYYNHTFDQHNRARRIHIDHCLNHVRQVVQCHMDLTPVRTLYFDEMNTEVGDFDQVHMCRDFSRLHRYMAEREPKEGQETHQMNKAQMRGHREGYIENEESFLPWDTDWKEFE